MSTLFEKARLTALGHDFLTTVLPTPLQHRAQFVAVNHELAKDFALAEDFFQQENTLSLLSGGDQDSEPLPFATVYSGHQFGVWAGQLGDGRALCLGERVDQQGQRHEWQLKGAGKTPYSRFGDGRAVLRSSIREYLCSEAMHALGIPTSRAFALVTSDDPVYRETVEKAAIVTRIAPSFLRFGHVEHFYFRGEHQHLQQLLDMLIDHHYPECRAHENPYEALFETILQRTAALVARWQSVGFCHGVMNTDNMSLLGLTIDYGPFGFLDAYDSAHICNHSDHQGRYAYQEQPYIAYWNLVRLANGFLPFITQARLKALLDRFPPYMENAYQERMRAKLGLATEQATDGRLIANLLLILQENSIDFTLFFRYLALLSLEEMQSLALLEKTPLSSLWQGQSLETIFAWLQAYAQRLSLESLSHSERQVAMNAVNPLYILRNYLLQEAIEKAEEGDFSGVDALYRCMKNPFTPQEEFADMAKLPPEWAKEICVSCSS